MQYLNIKRFESFCFEIDKYLTDYVNQVPVIYHMSNISGWESDGLSRANEDLLSSVSGSANIYVIFTAVKNSRNYTLRYIGKTIKKIARQRLRNHLIIIIMNIGAYNESLPN